MVAIILIIAAIAIPNLLRARIAANESSAVSSIRTINTGQATYQMTFPTFGYASTLAMLGPAAAGCAAGPVQANACLIDIVLASANGAATAKSGYYFTVTAPGAVVYTDYTVGGAAANWNVTGVRGFCSNSDGVIRFTASLNGAPVTTNAACVAYTNLQ